MVALFQLRSDKHEIEPTLDKLEALTAALGETETLLADAGYFSGANVEACVKAGVTPVIAMGRQRTIRLWLNASPRHRRRPRIRRRSRRWRIG